MFANSRFILILGIFFSSIVLFSSFSEQAWAHPCDDNYNTEEDRSACWWRYWNNQSLPQDQIQSSATPEPAAAIPTSSPTPPVSQSAVETNDPNVVCNQHYTTQQDKENCWWRFHNDLPLIEESNTPAGTTSAGTDESNYHCLTLEELEYVHNAFRVLKLASDAQGVLYGLLDLLYVDDSLVYNEKWTNAADDSIETMYDIYRIATMLSPPRSLSKLHLQYLRTAKDYSLAANAFRLGLRYSNMQLIDTGFDRLDTATDSLATTIALSDAYC